MPPPAARAAQDDYPLFAPSVPQGPPDPPLRLALLCCGATSAQREAGLRSARLAVQLLQTDASHGTLPASQLAEGQGEPCPK